jgi:hypothetical protein
VYGLNSWQKILRFLSILWLLGIVAISTKTVGEERLQFRENWYEECLNSNKFKLRLEQRFKKLDVKTDRCFNEARKESLKAIPDYILLKKIGFWGILPIILSWFIGFKLIKKVLGKE